MVLLYRIIFLSLLQLQLLLLHNLLSADGIEISSTSSQKCNISSTQFKNPPRAVVLSVNDVRYEHTKSILEKTFIGLNVTRWYPIPYTSPELDVYSTRYKNYIKCKKGHDGRHQREYYEESKLVLSNTVERKVFSNLVGFIHVLEAFAREPATESDEEDWLLIFEDDIAVHPGAQQPTCDVIEGLAESSSEGSI